MLLTHVHHIIAIGCEDYTITELSLLNIANPLICLSYYVHVFAILQSGLDAETDEAHIICMKIKKKTKA